MPAGPVVFTAREAGVWVRFTDASGAQLLQKELGKLQNEVIQMHGGLGTQREWETELEAQRRQIQEQQREIEVVHANYRVSVNEEWG